MRIRLVLLAVLTMSPLVLDRVRLLEADRNRRIEAAAAETFALARQGSESQQEVVLATRALLRIVAKTRDLLRTNGEGCGRFLAQAQPDVPWLAGMTVADAGGRITCSTFANSVGLDLSDRPYFQRAKATGDFVMSDYLIGRLQRAPTVVAALPITAEGRVQAMLIASINLEWVGRLATTLGQRLQSTVILLDSRATVLAAYPNAPGLAGKSFVDHPMAKLILERGEGAFRGAGLDGRRRVFGYVRLPGTDSHLVIGVDEAQVLSGVDRDMRIAYAQLAVAALLILLGAWLFGERMIVRPIRSLVRTAARFGQGNLEARVADRAWVAEFAPLARALEDMARRLAAREEDLRLANERLGMLASTDGLTGLANRMTFDARLAQEWRRSAEKGGTLALLMIDVDHFKSFNDAYGHLDGDACLRAIAGVLSEIAPPGALAARYGGEEFVVLLPADAGPPATEVADRIRRGVEKLDVRHSGSPNGQVTVSIGAAEAAAALDTPPSSLIELADDALYRAKRRGRNLVVAQLALPLPQAC